MSEYNQMVKQGVQTIGKRIRRVFGWILLVLILGGGIYLVVCNLTYSNGQRAGTLIKISRKGVVFKTYEGQLNLGGVSMDAEAGLSGNIWEFSVQKNDIYDELQDLQGQKVKLYYRQKYKGMPWQGKTDYFVYQVELVRQLNE